MVDQKITGETGKHTHWKQQQLPR